MQIQQQISPVASTPNTFSTKDEEVVMFALWSFAVRAVGWRRMVALAHFTVLLRSVLPRAKRCDGGP